MFHDRLWYWRWSWGRLWFVVWVPCRQKREGPSGRHSTVLAQISQRRVSCSNCPPKCDDSPTISQTSWIICLRSARIASRTFATFPVLCLSTVVQNTHRRRQRFVRPSSVCTIKKFCLGVWHYLRRLPVAFGGVLQQFFEDWNKIWCRFFAP